MDAFGEIIGDIWHKKFIKKSNLKRHVKTIHEKFARDKLMFRL